LWFRIEFQARGAPHVHGCLRLENDPGLAKLAKNVFEGRLAVRILSHINELEESDCFDEEDTELDSFEDLDKLIETGLVKNSYSTEKIIEMKEQIRQAKRSQKILVAYQDFFITTMNVGPPSDAASDTRDENTFFDPCTSTLRHPSAINPSTLMNNPVELKNLYCRSCNVQGRHKHQAYCDKNHSKREIERRKFQNNEPEAIDPATIECDCRFDFPFEIQDKSHVVIKQKYKNGELKTRLKIVSKRNDRWMNSHMRAVMEASTSTFIYTYFNTIYFFFLTTRNALQTMEISRYGEQIWIGNL
jgi:hypothetical protein